MHTNQKLTCWSISIVPNVLFLMYQSILINICSIHELRYLWSFICFICMWSTNWATTRFVDWICGHWAVKNFDFLHYQNIVCKLYIVYSTHLANLCAFLIIFRCPYTEKKVLYNFVKIS